MANNGPVNRQCHSSQGAVWRDDKGVGSTSTQVPHRVTSGRAVDLQVFSGDHVRVGQRDMSPHGDRALARNDRVRSHRCRQSAGRNIDNQAVQRIAIASGQRAATTHVDRHCLDVGRRHTAGDRLGTGDCRLRRPGRGECDVGAAVGVPDNQQVASRVATAIDRDPDQAVGRAGMRQDDRVVARISVDQQLVLHRELDVLEIVELHLAADCVGPARSPQRHIITAVGAVFEVDRVIDRTADAWLDSQRCGGHHVNHRFEVGEFNRLSLLTLVVIHRARRVVGTHLVDAGIDCRITSQTQNVVPGSTAVEEDLFRRPDQPVVVDDVQVVVAFFTVNLDPLNVTSRLIDLDPILAFASPHHLVHFVDIRHRVVVVSQPALDRRFLDRVVGNIAAHQPHHALIHHSDHPIIQITRTDHLQLVVGVTTVHVGYDIDTVAGSLDSVVDRPGLRLVTEDQVDLVRIVVAIDVKGAAEHRTAKIDRRVGRRVGQVAVTSDHNRTTSTQSPVLRNRYVLATVNLQVATGDHLRRPLHNQAVAPTRTVDRDQRQIAIDENIVLDLHLPHAGDLGRARRSDGLVQRIACNGST